jgi:hypothetical protein
MARDNIVLDYAVPAVRDVVKRTLAAMRAQGAGIVRTILWFRHVNANGRTLPSGADVLGLLPATDGRLPVPVLQNIVTYASDVRNAGFRFLFLPIGPQVEANPKCRRLQWGDCFDAKTMALSWPVIDQVERAVRPLNAPGFHVMLDIAPEDCPEVASKDPIAQTMRDYARYMVTRFSAAYGRDFIVSCGGGPSAAVALRRVDAMAQLYRGTAVRPAALDVHIYDQPAGEIEKTLLGVEARAERMAVPFYVLETYHDHPDLFRSVRRLRRDGRLSSLQILAVFPLDHDRGCQESLVAPYSLDALQAAVN